MLHFYLDVYIYVYLIHVNIVTFGMFLCGTLHMYIRVFSLPRRNGYCIFLPVSDYIQKWSCHLMSGV